LIVVATVSAEPTNDCRPVTSMTTSRADRFPASARARHSAASATGSLANCRTLARPWEIRVSLTTGSKEGRGPSTSKPDNSVFHSCSMNISAVCGETWARRTSRAISAASASVSPSTNVAAGRISSSPRVRPNRGSRPFTSA
jgi:hypothetical protein